MTEMKKTEYRMPQCLSTHSTPMTTAHKLKLKPIVIFSNFILTFTWTAFFPVAAAEPDPDPLPPDFASLFILLVFFTELLVQSSGRRYPRATIAVI